MEANKLKQILSGAKAIMNKVESGDFETGNIDSSLLSQQTVETVTSVQPTNGASKATSAKKQPPINEEKIRNSKLPDAIKKAMLETPIEVPESPFHSFNLDDINIEEEKPVPQKLPTKKLFNKETNHPSKASTLTEDDIRRIIREEFKDIIYEYFDSAVIKEDIQIKVGNTIFSGNLKPLPRKK